MTRVRSVRVVLAALVTAGLVALPRVAAACPFCAGRSGGGKGVAVAIGAMIALPYPIVALVTRLIRRGEQLDREVLQAQDAPGRDAPAGD